MPVFKLRFWAWNRELAGRHSQGAGKGHRGTSGSCAHAEIFPAAPPPARGSPSALRRAHQDDHHWRARRIPLPEVPAVGLDDLTSPKRQMSPGIIPCARCPKHWQSAANVRGSWALSSFE